MPGISSTRCLNRYIEIQDRYIQSFESKPPSFCPFNRRLIHYAFQDDTFYHTRSLPLLSRLPLRKFHVLELQVAMSQRHPRPAC